MSTGQASLHEQLQALVAEGVEGVSVAWDPVNPAMIRHWCDTMGDRNPAYSETEASATRHGGVVAPPAMLQAWVLPGAGGTAAPGSVERDPGMEARQLLLDAGYAAVVGTDCEQTYLRYLKPGEKLVQKTRLESISAEKQTALGSGFFITQLMEYFTGDGEKVAEMRFRTLRYKSAQDKTAAPEPRPPRPRPGINRDNAHYWQGLQRGVLLIQRCTSCQRLRHPTAPMCPSCQSLEWDTVEASGKGTIYSFVVMHHPKNPAFDHPNPIAVVELAEGTRLIAGLTGFDTDNITIGTPVELEVLHCDEGLSVPVFKPGERA